jgi:hypothetical protein
MKEMYRNMYVCSCGRIHAKAARDVGNQSE